jgi:predicted kinase
MALTLFWTIGLPASGKSTWAEAYVRDNKSAVNRINKDDLRTMLHASEYSKDNEKFVLATRDYLIRQSLCQGRHVIVDDTNFSDKHVQRFEEIASEFRKQGRDVKVKCVDFTHVDVEECIKRDLKRARSVGEAVIRKMHRDFLAPKPAAAPPYNPDLPDCIIIDLDGTIALNNGHRGWYDYSKCYYDEVNHPVVDAVRTFLDAKGCIPVFVSGREETCRLDTIRFIAERALLPIVAPHVYMRKTGDHREDSIVKRELYEAHIRGKYNVLHVWDDRRSVCEAWRQMGLTVFQVAEGNF